MSILDVQPATYLHKVWIQVFGLLASYAHLSVIPIFLSRNCHLCTSTRPFLPEPCGPLRCLGSAYEGMHSRTSSKSLPIPWMSVLHRVNWHCLLSCCLYHILPSVDLELCNGGLNACKDALCVANALARQINGRRNAVDVGC